MGATVTTDQRGFSLLETMIALCILAVVAAGVLPQSTVSILKTSPF